MKSVLPQLSGDIVGEHTVFFFMDGERIELTHKQQIEKFSLELSELLNGLQKRNRFLLNTRYDRMLK